MNSPLQCLLRVRQSLSNLLQQLWRSFAVHLSHFLFTAFQLLAACNTRPRMSSLGPLEKLRAVLVSSSGEMICECRTCGHDGSGYRAAWDGSSTRYVMSHAKWVRPLSVRASKLFMRAAQMMSAHLPGQHSDVLKHSSLGRLQEDHWLFRTLALALAKSVFWEPYGHVQWSEGLWTCLIWQTWTNLLHSILVCHDPPWNNHYPEKPEDEKKEKQK